MAKKKPVKQSSGAGKQWAGVFTVLVLVLGSGWLAFGYFRGDDLSALNELREKMRDDSLTDEQRRALRDEMRTQYEQLTPETRQQLRNEREGEWNRRMQTQLAAFFAKSPEDQQKELDKQIKEMEKRRKEWEKRRQERGGENRGSDRGDRGNNVGGGEGGGGGGGGSGGRGSGRSSAERAKDRLNNTTPELRSMRSDYFSMMQDRRKALGLPPMRGRRGG